MGGEATASSGLAITPVVLARGRIDCDLCQKVDRGPQRVQRTIAEVTREHAEQSEEYATSERIPYKVQTTHMWYERASRRLTRSVAVRIDGAIAARRALVSKRRVVAARARGGIEAPFDLLRARGESLPNLWVRRGVTPSRPASSSRLHVTGNDVLHTYFLRVCVWCGQVCVSLADRCGTTAYLAPLSMLSKYLVWLSV